MLTINHYLHNERGITMNIYYFHDILLGRCSWDKWDCTKMRGTCICLWGIQLQEWKYSFRQSFWMRNCMCWFRWGDTEKGYNPKTSKVHNAFHQLTLITIPAHNHILWLVNVSFEKLNNLRLCILLFIIFSFFFV